MVTINLYFEYFPNKFWSKVFTTKLQSKSL